MSFPDKPKEGEAPEDLHVGMTDATDTEDTDEVREFSALSVTHEVMYTGCSSRLPLRPLLAMLFIMMQNCFFP